MRKKLLASVLVAAMAITMLAGCGSTDDNTTGSTAPAASTTESAATTTVAADAESIVSAPTELTFIFADGDEGAKASMNEIVNRFNAAYPDITVTIEPGNGGAYSEFIKTKDSVGEFPDVMEMRDTAMYVRAGKLEPLSEEISPPCSAPPQNLTVRYTQLLCPVKIHRASFTIKNILMTTVLQSPLHMKSL